MTSQHFRNWLHAVCSTRVSLCVQPWYTICAVLSWLQYFGKWITQPKNSDPMILPNYLIRSVNKIIVLHLLHSQSVCIVNIVHHASNFLHYCSALLSCIESGAVHVAQYSMNFSCTALLSTLKLNSSTHFTLIRGMLTWVLCVKNWKLWPHKIDRHTKEIVQHICVASWNFNCFLFGGQFDFEKYRHCILWAEMYLRSVNMPKQASQVILMLTVCLLRSWSS